MGYESHVLSPVPPQSPPTGGASRNAPGGGGDDHSPIAAFLNAYPIPTTRLSETRQLFDALEPQERQRAIEAAAGFAVFCERQKRKPMDAAKFLRDPEQWAQFLRYAPRAEPDRVFYEHGSDGSNAWGVLFALMTGFRAPGPFENRNGQRGGWFDQLPNGAEALAAFVPEAGSRWGNDWVLVEFESRQWWAWAKRARHWGAELFEPDMIDTGETYDQKLPGGRKETMPLRVKGLRFPLEWPPPLGPAANGDDDNGTDEGGDDGTQDGHGTETGEGSDPVAAAGGT